MLDDSEYVGSDAMDADVQPMKEEHRLGDHSDDQDASNVFVADDDESTKWYLVTALVVTCLCASLLYTDPNTFHVVFGLKQWIVLVEKMMSFLPLLLAVPTLALWQQRKSGQKIDEELKQPIKEEGQVDGYDEFIRYLNADAKKDTGALKQKHSGSPQKQNLIRNMEDVKVCPSVQSLPPSVELTTGSSPSPRRKMSRVRSLSKRIKKVVQKRKE